MDDRKYENIINGFEQLKNEAESYRDKIKKCEISISEKNDEISALKSEVENAKLHAEEEREKLIAAQELSQEKYKDLIIELFSSPATEIKKSIDVQSKKGTRATYIVAIISIVVSLLVGIVPTLIVNVDSLTTISEIKKLNEKTISLIQNLNKLDKNLNSYSKPDDSSISETLNRIVNNSTNAFSQLLNKLDSKIFVLDKSISQINEAKIDIEKSVNKSNEKVNGIIGDYTKSIEKSNISIDQRISQISKNIDQLSNKTNDLAKKTDTVLSNGIIDTSSKDMFTLMNKLDSKMITLDKSINQIGEANSNIENNIDKSVEKMNNMINNYTKTFEKSISSIDQRITLISNTIDQLSNKTNELENKTGTLFSSESRITYIINLIEENRTSFNDYKTKNDVLLLLIMRIMNMKDIKELKIKEIIEAMNTYNLASKFNIDYATIKNALADHKKYINAAIEKIKKEKDLNKVIGDKEKYYSFYNINQPITIEYGNWYYSKENITYNDLIKFFSIESSRIDEILNSNKM